MVTYAPDPLEWLVDAWEDAIGSAVCSGIVGDPAHQEKPSKHNSRQDNPSGSWATSHSKDQKGPSNMACAVDVSMNDADMKKVHNRFINLYNARKSDPRAGYVDCFNGYNGSGGAKRYDLPAGTISGTDDSHEWHEHVESFYLYAGTDEESWTAARAILSVVKGETADQWLAVEEDDMTKDQFFDFMDAWVKSRFNEPDSGDQNVVAIRNYMRAWTLNYKGGGLPAGMSFLNVFNQMYETGEMSADVLDKVAAEVGIDAAELEQMKQAAFSGAQAGAADLDELMARFRAELETGLTDEQQADVERSLRNVLVRGTEDTPAAIEPAQ